MPATFPTAAEPSHLCYTRASLGDAWVENSLLECLRFNDLAGPAHSSAVLTYRYGSAMLPEIGARAADTAYATVSRPNLNGLYLKVEVAGVGDWFGIITESDDSQAADLAGTTPSGLVSLTAMGLTYLLDVQPLRTSRVLKDDGDTWDIGVAVPFNAGADGRGGGDRWSKGNFEPTYLAFADATATSEPAEWTAADALEYLFDFHGPKDADGTALFDVVINNADALGFTLPRMDYQGLTLWDTVNRIVDRRRGLYLRPTFNGGTDRLELEVYSQAATAISLPDGSTLPANTNTTTINVSSSVNVKSCVLTGSAVSTVDQVRVIGAKRTTTLTLKPGEQLEPDWRDDDVDDYNTAKSAEAGYTNLSDEDKAARNADYRARDRFRHVFAAWRLQRRWEGDQHLYDYANATTAWVWKAQDEDGEEDTGTDPFWWAALRILDWTPLKPELDYSGVIFPDVDTDTEATEYQPPFVLVKTEPTADVPADLEDDGYIYAERLDAASTTESTKRPFDWTVQLKSRADAPGIYMEVVGGQQHYLADDLYVSNGAYEDTETGKGIDHEDFLLTCTMEHQSDVLAVYPPTADVTAGDVARIKDIRLPEARQDYLAPGAVVGVDGGKPIVTEGGFIRDDRETMKTIAQIAHVWHGEVRQVLSLRWRSIEGSQSVGQLITSLDSASGSQTVNTVVTSIDYNLAAGMTSLQTQSAELDYGALL